MGRRAPESVGRVFLACAAIAVVPVVVLGLVLAANYRSESARRGLTEGTEQAELVAGSAVEPVLDGHALSDGLTPSERTAMQRIAARAVANHSVLRLRLRDLAGHVVFSGDGSGLSPEVDDEAAAAGRGVVTSLLTRVNSDANDTGGTGAGAVEVYLPVSAGSPPRRVGVLEVYVPYAPIRRDLDAALHTLYRDLVVGLALLYVVLLGISASMTRLLRRQVAMNTFLAEHDTLTELPNRDVFRRLAAQAVRDSRRSPVALGIMDLDRFKEVNDGLGHHSGDQLLVALAERLTQLMRPGDTVARLGGDEFGVILHDVEDPAAALTSLRSAIQEDIDVGGLPLSIEASIGYVVLPDDGKDVGELLQRADVAMYAAKLEHGGVARYHRSQNRYDAETLSLVTEFRHAIERGELFLEYQPTITLRDGRVHALEALLRWQHPRDGRLLPERFLPIVECTDLIDPLTDWVLARALADLDALGPAFGDVRVAVNVSARNFGRDDFAPRVRAALTAAVVEPRRLVLEITETALLDDRQRARAVVVELHEAGVEVSLDDFGAGQTSLGYLSGLPIEELKIDQRFVGDLLENPAHAAIVRSMVDLGHHLGLRVVAEGIESEDVLVRLRTAGCDIGQGFLLASPLPPREVAAWLSAHDAARAAAHDAARGATPVRR